WITAIHSLALHDALPIWNRNFSRPIHLEGPVCKDRAPKGNCYASNDVSSVLLIHEAPRPEEGGRPDYRPPRSHFNLLGKNQAKRSEEHTSELQSRENLVC